MSKNSPFSPTHGYFSFFLWFQQVTGVFRFFNSQNTFDTFNHHEKILHQIYTRDLGAVRASARGSLPPNAPPRSPWGKLLGDSAPNATDSRAKDTASGGMNRIEAKCQMLTTPTNQSKLPSNSQFLTDSYHWQHKLTGGHGLFEWKEGCTKEGRIENPISQVEGWGLFFSWNCDRIGQKGGVR